MISMGSEPEEPKTVRFPLYVHLSGPPKNSPRKFPRISERCDSRYVLPTFAILGTKRVQIGKFNNRGALITRGEGYLNVSNFNFKTSPHQSLHFLSNNFLRWIDVANMLMVSSGVGCEHRSEFGRQCSEVGCLSCSL